MGFIRRFLSIGLGLAAGAFAVKLLRDYNNDGHIEGDYVEVPLTEEDDTAPAGEEEPYHAAQKPDRGPNPNPVDLGAAEKPLTEKDPPGKNRRVLFVIFRLGFTIWNNQSCSPARPA